MTNLIKETTSVGKSTNKSSFLDFVAVFLKSKRAINEIRSVMESGNWFSSALAAVPIYQIFFSPGVTKSAFETGINIREHDWEQYASSMGSAPKIVRDRIRKTAEPMTWYTSGNENKFWRCVSEAAL